MTYPGIPLDGKPYPIDAADCQECGRLDFPVLLVRPSVVDKRHEASLASGTRLYDQTRDTAFGRMKRKGTLPVTRLLRQGYVYVYYQARGKWDLWRSHDDGTYLKLLELATPEQYAEYAHEFTAEYGPNPAGSVCSRGAVNVPAGLITLVGPGGQADIWVAYATHAWDPQVLNDYGAAKSTARALRMTHLNGQALMAQGVLPTMGSLLAQSTLEACIPEFSPLMPPAGAAHHPLLKVFERSASPLAPTRFGRAADYDAAARRLEASAEPAAANKALVLMLADPVGVAQDYNDIRLGIHEERQHWMNGGPDATGGNADPDRPWKRQSMLCAGYIRDWLRERQRANVQARHEGGAIKDTITITETEFQRIQADAAAGKPRYPAGTRYERLDTVPVVYRVHWPTTMVERGLEGMAQGQAQPRIDRYNGHLDWARIEHTNQQWLEQEQGWRELQEARDQDYVDWLRSEVLLTVLRHDYADRPLLAQSAREASQFEADLRNAMARLDAVARCYGGGACGPASLKHLIDLFGKDEDDPEHWIASAAIKPFDLLATLRTDPGAQASLYDVLVGNRKAAIEQLREGWQSLRETGVVHLATLLLVSTQVTHQMRYLALAPQAAKELGIASQLALAQAKEGLWVRAGALLDFLDSGQRRYLVGIIAGTGPAAAPTPGKVPSAPAGIGRIEPYPESSAGRQADRAAQRMSRAKAALRAPGPYRVGKFDGLPGV
ncbi:TPA: T6SS effector BTH_I2691 family protein [Pseudomonas aeruginosa]